MQMATGELQVDTQGIEIQERNHGSLCLDQKQMFGRKELAFISCQNTI